MKMSSFYSSYLWDPNGIECEWLNPSQPIEDFGQKTSQTCFIISVALQSSPPQLHNIPLVQSHNNTSCNKRQPKKKALKSSLYPSPHWSFNFSEWKKQKKKHQLSQGIPVYLHHLPLQKKHKIHQGLHTTWCIRSIRKSRTWWTPWIRRASRITLSILSFLSRIRRNKKIVEKVEKWKSSAIFSKCSSCWFTWNSRWWPVNSDLFLGVPYGCRWMGWITKTGSSILGAGGSAYTLASLSLTCGCLCKSKIHRQMDVGGFR